MAVKRDWVTEVLVFWGRTGAGKTRLVHELATDLYIHPGGAWFDGYDGQADVLFDDFGGSDFRLPYLLKLLDRYQMTVPIKGGFVQWAPRRIFITSNIDPNNWYSGAFIEHQAALRRRITGIRHFE